MSAVLLNQVIKLNLSNNATYLIFDNFELIKPSLINV